MENVHFTGRRILYLFLFLLFCSSLFFEVAYAKDWDPSDGIMPDNAICVDLRVNAEKRKDGFTTSDIGAFLGCPRVFAVEISVTAEEEMFRRVADKISKMEGPIIGICTRGSRSKKIEQMLPKILEYYSLTGGTNYILDIKNLN